MPCHMYSGAHSGAPLGPAPDVLRGIDMTGCLREASLCKWKVLTCMGHGCNFV